MSSLLRLSGALRSLRTPQPTHFFSPSHTPQRSNLTRLRLYSRYLNQGNRYRTYESQLKANNTVLYALMGTNIAVFSYAMYLKQQAQQGYQLPFTRFIQKMTLNYTEFKNGAYFPLIASPLRRLKSP